MTPQKSHHPKGQWLSKATR